MSGPALSVWGSGIRCFLSLEEQSRFRRVSHSAHTNVGPDFLDQCAARRIQRAWVRSRLARRSDVASEGYTTDGYADDWDDLSTYGTGIFRRWRE